MQTATATKNKVKKENENIAPLAITVGDESDDDDESQVAKKMKSSHLTKQDIIDCVKETLPELVRQGVIDALSDITLKAQEKKSFSDFQTAFTCTICQHVARPPVVVSMCCSSALGCNTCVDRWYEQSNNCTKCRVNQNETLPRTILKGFDDTLLGISRLSE